MNFDILSTDEHSRCDFSAIIKFDTWENAQQAVRLIVNKPYANGDLTDGKTGAFRVGTYVMFNVFSQETYLHLVRELRDTAAPTVSPVIHHEPAGGLQAVMFDLLATQAYNTVSKEYSAQMGQLSRNFLSRYLPKATYLSTNTEYEEYVRWVELWFLYKDKTYHLDFCTEDGNNTLRLYTTTNKYQANVDCAYVTVDTLQEKIDFVDDTGHFPGHNPGCTREEADERDREIPRKSLEERLDKVEHLIASLQDEVTEIKKKI